MSASTPAPPELPDRIITREQAARHLGVSLKTLDRLADLPVVRLSPRRVGFRLSDLSRWVQERTTTRGA